MFNQNSQIPIRDVGRQELETSIQSHQIDAIIRFYFLGTSIDGSQRVIISNSHQRIDNRLLMINQIPSIDFSQPGPPVVGHRHISL